MSTNIFSFMIFFSREQILFKNFLHNKLQKKILLSQQFFFKKNFKDGETHEKNIKRYPST